MAVALDERMVVPREIPLLIRVLEGSYRADRHGSQLATAKLPADPPRKLSPGHWHDLIDLQGEYRAAVDEQERKAIALEFGETVRRLHADERVDCLRMWDDLGPAPSKILRAKSTGDGELVEALEAYADWRDAGRQGPAPRRWIALSSVATCTRCSGCAAL